MSFTRQLSENSLSRRRSNLSEASLLPVTAPTQQTCSGAPSRATMAGATAVFVFMLLAASMFFVRNSPVEPVVPEASVVATAESAAHVRPRAEPAAVEQAPVRSDPTAPVAAAATVVAKSGKPCRDTNARCIDWANAGECGKNQAYMMRSCPRSCNACSESDAEAEGAAHLEDSNKLCPQWAAAGECANNPTYMHHMCAFSCSQPKASARNHDES